MLGIDRDANVKEIKRAYRRIAKVNHPDVKKGDPDAEKKFQEINLAYEVLTDPEKRKLYDQGGEEALKNQGNSQSSGFGSFGNDIFASFFGDFFDFGSSSSHEEPAEVRGANVVVDLPVTLEEIYDGEFVEIIRNKPVRKRSSGTRECNCRMEMHKQLVSSGQYRIIQHRVCDSCPNVRFETEERLIEVEIEIGVRDNHVYTFKGEGEPHVDKEPGDLKVQIKIEKHPIFKRVGNNLYTNVSISLLDSLVGFKFNLTHLDGHLVLVERTAVTRTGETIIVRNEGMPDYEYNQRKGHLYITFDVDFPTTTFNKEQIEDLTRVLGSTSLAREYTSINKCGA